MDFRTDIKDYIACEIETIKEYIFLEMEEVLQPHLIFKMISEREYRNM